jgi:hypothetical protein
MTDESTPRQDPTALTTDALDREIGRLKELLQVQITGIEDRLDDYQETHAATHASRIKEIQSEVRHLTELMAERFKGIADTMVERDARVADTALAGKEAIDAALTSQKEMATKAETAFTKQIDGIEAKITVLDQARQEQIRAIEKRVDASEGTSVGLNTALSRTIAITSVLVAIIAIAVSVIITTR